MPTSKDVIILEKVTITGKGDNPNLHTNIIEDNIRVESMGESTCSRKNLGR